jgi:hypothetical protein
LVNFTGIQEMTELEQSRRTAAQCAAQVLAGSNPDLYRVASMIVMFEQAQALGGAGALAFATALQLSVPAKPSAAPAKPTVNVVDFKPGSDGAA